MPILHSSVWTKSGVLLCEAAQAHGNFAQVARDYLNFVAANEGQFAYTLDGHTLLFLHRAGFIYLAVAEETYGKIIPAAFLEKAAAEFSLSAAGKPPTSFTEGSQSGFVKNLKTLMSTANTNPGEFSKIAKVQDKVKEVTTIMSGNIEKLMERGDKLVNLEGKTDELAHMADEFARTGRQVRRTMWCQNMKMKLVIALTIVLLAVVVFLLVCFSGGNCLK